MNSIISSDSFWKDEKTEIVTLNKIFSRIKYSVIFFKLKSAYQASIFNFVLVVHKIFVFLFHRFLSISNK